MQSLAQKNVNKTKKTSRVPPAPSEKKAFDRDAIWRKRLPWPLEKLCFSFLDIADLADGLFFVSHALAQRVQTYFRELHTLTGEVSVSGESAAARLLLSRSDPGPPLPPRDWSAFGPTRVSASERPCARCCPLPTSAPLTLGEAAARLTRTWLVCLARCATTHGPSLRQSGFAAWHFSALEALCARAGNLTDVDVYSDQNRPELVRDLLRAHPNLVRLSVLAVIPRTTVSELHSTEPLTAASLASLTLHLADDTLMGSLLCPI